MIKNFNDEEKQQYTKLIQQKFSDLYFKNNDASHAINQQSQISSSIKSLEGLKSFYVTAPHREEIFFNQYPMEKKGKKFGTSQMRLLKCVQQSGQIYQVDKNRQAKVLPYPSSFKIQTKQSIKDSNEVEWNNKLLTFQYRIKLFFEQRGQIFVYFDLQENCFEIAAFLKSLINKSKKKSESLFIGSKKLSENVAINFKEKLLMYRREVEKRKQLKRKLKGVKKIQSKFKDSLFIIQLMEKWRLKTFQKEEANGSSKYQVRINLMKVCSSKKQQKMKIAIKNTDGKLTFHETELIQQVRQNNKQINETSKYFVYKPVKGQQNSNEFQIGLKQKIIIKLNFKKEKVQRIREQQLVQISLTSNLDDDQDVYQSEFTLFQLKYLNASCDQNLFYESSNFHNVNSKKSTKQTGRLIAMKLRKRNSNIQNKDCQYQQRESLAVLFQISWKNQHNNKSQQVIEQNYGSQKLTMPSQIYQSQVKPYQQNANLHSQSYMCQRQSHQVIESYKPICHDQTKMFKSFSDCQQFYRFRDGIEIHHYFSFIKNHHKLEGKNHNEEFPSSQIEINLNPNSHHEVNAPLTLKNYSQIYSSYVKNNHAISISFNCVEKLVHTFKVSQLIEKFLLSQTFKPYSQAQHKGTKIFSLLVQKSQSIRYYDVQKLILEFGDSSLRRVLNAIKTFDESLRINFTQPLYKLTQRILNVVRQSFVFQEQNSEMMISQLFDKTISGVESCAFFIILGIVKQFSSIFIYQKQVQKRSLHQNTLLFKLVLKKQFPQIWQKCSLLQLNVQALFGISLVSLLSDYFNNQLFVQFVCEEVHLSQKKSSNGNGNGNNINSNKLNFNMIAIFIALIGRVMNHSDDILTAQSFIVYLNLKSRQIDNPSSFKNEIQKIRHLVQFYNEGEYVTLIKQLNEIYANSALNQNNLQESRNKLSFGSLSHAVYSQFTDDRSKHMTESRLSTSFLNENQLPTNKMYLFVNALHIDQSINVRKILFQIYQGKNVLYSHQFKNIDIQTFTLTLQLQIKSNQNLVLYIKTKPRSYYYVLNILKLQSNFYHHFVRPLADSVKHNAIESNEFIQFEVFLKNHVLTQRFQNVIPPKYCQTFLYNSQIKQSILQTSRYLKNYRMKDNNFNLLYTKLAWYGNHYLIPHDRLLTVNIFHQNQFMTDETPLKQNLKNHQIFSTLQYTRTIFGKGIVPKIKDQPHTMAILDLVKNNMRVIQSKDFGYQSVKNSSQLINEHKSSNQLLTFVMENFDMQNINTFFQFYQKMCQLPLIDYLTYDPLTHYVLPPIQFHCIYVNSIQGVKLKFVVFFCDSAEQRKQGEPWQQLINDFTQQELERLQKQFQALQAHFFHKDRANNPFNSSHNQSSQGANRFGFVPTQRNMKMKQFYTMFPQTFNFSFPTSSKTSIDVFSNRLKYNIIRVILKKFSKINHNIHDKFERLEESVVQTQEKFHINHPLNHYYQITLIQDNAQIPNFDFYYLFRFMVETGKQLHVHVQLKKEKIRSSANDIQNITNINLTSPRGAQSSRLSATIKIENQKIKIQRNPNILKTYSNLGLIYGRYRRIQILTKQFKQIRLQSSTNLSSTQSRAQTVIHPEPQSPAITLSRKGQKQGQHINYYLGEEMITRKIHRLKQNDVLWKDTKVFGMYKNL